MLRWPSFRGSEKSLGSCDVENKIKKYFDVVKRLATASVLFTLKEAHSLRGFGTTCRGSQSLALEVEERLPLCLPFVH